MPGPPATNSEVQLNDLELVRAAASNGTKAAVASGNHSQATNHAPLDGDTHELSLHLENADLGNITADAFALAIVAEELTA
jgi:hypothetical protein